MLNMLTWVLSESIIGGLSNMFDIGGLFKVFLYRRVVQYVQYQRVVP